MKKLMYISILIGLFFFMSCNQDESNELIEQVTVSKDNSVEKSAWDYNYELASTTEELSKLMDNPKINIVRNAQDLQRFIVSDSWLKEVFSNRDIYNEIVRSMKTNRRGIKTFTYQNLQKFYPEDYKRIMIELSKGFGFDFWLATDYMDCACINSNCSHQLLSICIGANC